MKKIRCIVAEDELLSFEVLENYISKLDDYQLVIRCKNGIEVFNALKKEPVDLLFLDIQMPQLTGLEVVKSLKEMPSIIFTTAFREYAVDGYELNAIDYLLKPISFDRFLRAIDKFENASLQQHRRRYQKPEFQLGSTNSFIYVKSGKRTVKIFLKEILFIEGAKEFVKIRTIHEEIITYQTLQDFEQRLPDDAFIRIHRSFIIAVDHLRAYNATHAQVGNTEIPIGQSYQRTVKNMLR